MARYNEILAGRYNRFLTKLFSMKGSAPSPQASSEIGAVINFFSGVENRYLEQWETFAIASSVTGGAAQTGAARLRNPAGSNVILVIEKLTVATLVVNQANVQIASGLGDLTTIISSANVRLDSRTRPNPTAVYSQTVNLVLAGTDDFFAALAANTTYDLIQEENQEIPLMPGDSCTVVQTVTAVNMATGFRWRERFLEDSERT